MSKDRIPVTCGDFTDATIPLQEVVKKFANPECPVIKGDFNKDTVSFVCLRIADLTSGLNKNFAMVDCLGNAVRLVNGSSLADPIKDCEGCQICSQSPFVRSTLPMEHLQ